MTAPAALAMLDAIVAAKPGGVVREGQRRMVEAVAEALEGRHHLMVEAGTGTGKSFGYLVPALASGRRVVVATATKALQDQLAGSELPFLREQLGPAVTWAVLKGRQSYACMAKLVERFGPELDGSLLGEDDELFRVAAWAKQHPTGDRDDLDEAVSEELWREVSVSGMECPGRVRCPQGDVCFAEAAVRRAADVRIVVTNQHLYGLDLTTGGRLLPEHDAVVFDEAHKLEGALSAAFGVDLTPGRLSHFAGQARKVVPDRKGRGGRNLIQELRDAAGELRRALDAADGRVDAAEGELGAVLLSSSVLVGSVMKETRRLGEREALEGIAARVQQQGGHLAGDIAYALDLPDGAVAWVEGVALRVAPIEVSPHLGRTLLTSKPAVFTSATLRVAGSFAPIAARLGLLAEPLADDPFADGVAEPLARTYTAVDVPGSFDYRANSLLYVASHLPDPRSEEFVTAALDELAALLGASDGRALVLCTSHRMVRTVGDRLSGSPFPVLAQGDLPKRKLIAEFAGVERSVLVATMGYWEGIDVPGPALSLVVIDKLPFPRPDDPLTTARRERVTARGGSAFNEVDLPIAAMLLSQGAGRLIRSEDDRGVVAVLDSRLTRARYGMRIIRSLPPMQRTSDPERAVRFLRGLHAGAADAAT